MVLQRNEDLKIRGLASPGESVTLAFKGKYFDTTANQNGNWVIQIRQPSDMPGLITLNLQIYTTKTNYPPHHLKFLNRRKQIEKIGKEELKMTKPINTKCSLIH